MKLQDRINAFSKLGDFLSQFNTTEYTKKEAIAHNDLFFDGFKHQIKLASEANGWFTIKNITHSLKNWTNALSLNNLTKFASDYEFTNSPKKVAIIMAGNIPLVGFHDFLCVLLSGHEVVVKQSTNDKKLLPFLAKYLEYVAPEFKGKITFTDDRLGDFEAVIATGSDNTARYFEYYFKDKPAIIRKNRNSIAVLTGNETEDEMKALANDIFTYYGLGCRNVSKFFVPKGYNFDAFFNGIYHYNDIINDFKYANNYDYNKAVYLMSEFDMLENGFFMIKEDPSYSSPIATAFYEYYTDLDELKATLDSKKEDIQCVVTHADIPNSFAFGESQLPKLEDFADGVDTLQFLAQL